MRRLSFQGETEFDFGLAEIIDALCNIYFVDETLWKSARLKIPAFEAFANHPLAVLPLGRDKCIRHLRDRVVPRDLLPPPGSSRSDTVQWMCQPLFLVGPFKHLADAPDAECAFGADVIRIGRNLDHPARF
ncbi:hypothetical protein V1281_006749 [Nitrobacteraceae bacterium AZCC 2161]